MRRKHDDLINKKHTSNFYKKHKSEIFPKYKKQELIDCARKFQNGGKVLTQIFQHFFKEEIWKCRKDDVRLIPLEFLKNDNLINFAKKEIKKHPNFYHDGSISRNIEKFAQNQHSFTKLPTQFPIKVAKEIYLTYAKKLKKKPIDVNVFDSSCGFGSRMSAALLLGFNYYGIDPNSSLQKQLQKCAKFYRDNNLLDDNQICMLGETGSEIYYPQFKNKMDIAFTSPPYFSMEIYANDKFASTQNLNDYEKWKKKFLFPTIKNTYKYLKKGGYFLMNIRDSDRYAPMYTDAVNYCKTLKGFKQCRCNIKIDNQVKAWTDCTRTNSHLEDIMCFRKE